MIDFAYISHLLTGGLVFLGYTIVFLLAVLDSLAFIGFLLPGSTLVLFLGGLTYASSVSPFAIGVLYVAGALVGDVISYSMGRFMGTRLISASATWQDRVSLAKRKLDSGLIPALLVDRFVLPFRPIVSFAAGTTGVNILLLLFISMILNSIFVIGLSAGGYYLAAGVSLLDIWSQVSMPIISSLALVGFLAFVALSAFITTLIRVEDISNFKLIFKAFITRVQNSTYMQSFYEKHKRTKAIIEYILGFDFLRLVIISVSLFLVLFVADTTIDVWLHLESEVFAIDNSLSIYLNKYYVAFMGSFMFAITQLGSWWFTVLTTVGICFYLFKQRKYSLAVLSVFAILGAEGVTHLMKIIIARPRPDFMQIVETSYSFPSGHATAAAILCGLGLYFLMISKLNTATKIYGSYALFAVAILVAFSRIYLGVHYLSDVLVGLAIGSIFALIVVWSDQYIFKVRSSK